MAHPVRASEKWLEIGPERTRRRGEQALDRLQAVASRGRADAVLVVGVLESVADSVESHGVSAALPSAERDLWASVGARSEAGSRLESDRRLVDAFGSLISRSIIGDAAMASELGVDRSRVSQRLADRSLLSFTAGEERCFPRWQLVDGKPLPGLKVVLAAIDPAVHPLALDHWFTTPNVDLQTGDGAVSPVTWLATGGAPAAAASLAADL